MEIGDSLLPPEEAAATAPAEPAETGAAVAGAHPAVAAEPEPAPRPRWGGWTLPILCAGVAIIACALLIPQADENRRLAYEMETLKRDLAQIEHQVKANEEFAQRVVEDPSLAERLAQRQMNLIRSGTSVLHLKCLPDKKEMSPFLLTAIAPPEALAPYQPAGGKLAEICLHPRSQLYFIGVGLMLLAAGLVLGYAEPPGARRSSAATTDAGVGTLVRGQAEA